MRFLVIMTLLVLGTVTPRPASSLASMTSAVSGAESRFTATKIELTTSTSSALVSFSNMFPGHVIYGLVTMSNATGNGTLRYSIGNIATDTAPLGLAAALQLTIGAHATETACNATGFSSFTVIRAAGALGTGDGSTVTQLVGDPGAHTGRVLEPGTSENLCFKVELPSTTTIKEGASTSVVFRFIAEQVAGT